MQSRKGDAINIYHLAFPRTTLLVFCAMLLLFSAWVPDVQATCVINIDVKNMGKAPLSVRLVTTHTAVTLKGERWRSLKKGLWFGQTDRFGLNPGETKGDKYVATFKCQAERRYRVYYVCLAGVNKDKAFVDYYPSLANWTTHLLFTIPLRHCN